MKNLFSKLLLTCVLVGTFEFAQAQVKLPAASTSQEITQDLGIKKINLKYQRPSKKGRVIFGGLVPYNEVWRTGANNATALTFEDAVYINNQKIEAGTYALFTIPTPNDWTIILNKTAEQWGAYSYKAEDDVLRFTVPSSKTNSSMETFTINFENVQDNSLEVVIYWDNVRVAFPIKVDQTAEIMNSLEEAMKGERKPYFQAAQFYFNNNLDIQKAMEWIKEADQNNTRAPHIKYWKSKILLKGGDKAGAVAAAEEGVKMATELNNKEYITLNTQALNEAKK